MYKNARFIKKNVSKESISWGDNNDPRGILKENVLYEIEDIIEHSWHTEVFLKDFPEMHFNSVWFKFLK